MQTPLYVHATRSNAAVTCRRNFEVIRCRFNKSVDKAPCMVRDLWAKSCRKSIAIMVFACSFGSYSSRSERSMPSVSREGSSMRSTH
eukprot:scaffold11091_cov75-Phaeocystis_antarctica.AAC.1